MVSKGPRSFKSPASSCGTRGIRGLQSSKSPASSRWSKLTKHQFSPARRVLKYVVDKETCLAPSQWFGDPRTSSQISVGTDSKGAKSSTPTSRLSAERGCRDEALLRSTPKHARLERLPQKASDWADPAKELSISQRTKSRTGEAGSQSFVQDRRNPYGSSDSAAQTKRSPNPETSN